MPYSKYSDRSMKVASRNKDSRIMKMKHMYSDGYTGGYPNNNSDGYTGGMKNMAYDGYGEKVKMAYHNSGMEYPSAANPPAHESHNSSHKSGY